MGIMKKIVGVLTGGIVESAAKGADIVERWVPGAETKHEMAQEIDAAITAATGEARAYAAPGADGGFLGKLADGLSRLIRPVVTIYVLGVVFGFYAISLPEGTDPWYLAQAERILLFWFGGKVLLKDIPAAIAYLRKGR